MPDMTLCSNETCPLRESCYRFTATPDKLWQSYSCFEPYGDGHCLMFIPADAYSVMPPQNARPARPRDGQCPPQSSP